MIQHIKELPLERAYVLYCLPAMNQCEALSLPPAGETASLSPGP